MHYESMKHVFNKVDALKCESAATLIGEMIVDCLPAFKKGFSVHIDNGTVAYVSRLGFYPRYFISVNLDTETVTFRRYLQPEQGKGEVKALCHVQPESGRCAS